MDILRPNASVAASTSCFPVHAAQPEGETISRGDSVGLNLFVLRALRLFSFNCFQRLAQALRCQLFHRQHRVAAAAVGRRPAFTCALDLQRVVEAEGNQRVCLARAPV